MDPQFQNPNKGTAHDDMTAMFLYCHFSKKISDRAIAYLTNIFFSFRRGFSRTVQLHQAHHVLYTMCVRRPAIASARLRPNQTSREIGPLLIPH